MTLQEFFSRADVWCQGAPSDGKGRYCITAALDRFYNGEAYDAAYQKLLKQTYPRYIASWNDKRGRTIDDVRELVRKAGV